MVVIQALFLIFYIMYLRSKKPVEHKALFYINSILYFPVLQCPVKQTTYFSLESTHSSLQCLPFVVLNREVL